MQRYLWRRVQGQLTFTNKFGYAFIIDLDDAGFEYSHQELWAVSCKNQWLLVQSMQ